MFEDIVVRLTDPRTQYQITNTFLRVAPNNLNGVEVILRKISDMTYEVSLDGWHEPFWNYEEARKCFLSVLTGRFRIKRLRKGDFPFCWTLEHFAESQWRVVSTTRLLFYPFWRRTTVEYLQNEPLHDFSSTS